MKLEIEITQASQACYDLEVYGLEQGRNGLVVTHVYESRKGIYRRATVEALIRGAVEVAMDNLEGDGEWESVEDEGVWGKEEIR